MKASEANRQANRRLEMTSELLGPFLAVVFRKVSEAADKGSFEVSVGIPFRHDQRTPTQWSPSIADALLRALRDLGYTVGEKRYKGSTEGFGGDAIETNHTDWVINWAAARSGEPHPISRKNCDWCHGTGKDTSADGKREIVCGSCGGL